jgi:hypothetical protein
VENLKPRYRRILFDQITGNIVSLPASPTIFGTSLGIHLIDPLGNTGSHYSVSINRVD